MGTLSRALLFLVIAGLCGGCSDTTLEASYATLFEAVSEGAVERGWVPAWLPEGATDLKEIHDLDSGESALAFTLPDGSDWPPHNQCHPEESAGVTPSRFHPAWWPTASELEASYSFSSCFGERTENLVFVGVHHSGKRALHWRVAAR